MADGLVGATVRFAERGVDATRAGINQFLDSVKLRLRAIEVSRDPGKAEWVAEMRSLDSDEIERRLAEQPEPQVLIDRRRATAT